MFREGGGYSDLCLLSELLFWFKLLNVAMFLLVSSFFFQLFYWYICQFEQVFLWECQFSQEFWGCQFKNVCLYGVSLIQVTVTVYRL